MGGSSSANYPAPVLGGLFNGENRGFSSNPQQSNQNYGLAENALGGLPTQYATQSPFGFNPWGTAAAGNSLVGSANSAYQAGAGPFDQLATYGNQGFAAGQQQAGSLFPYVSQALKQGFDPQHALHDKLFQQQQDQSRAENAASGVSSTPYGAGLTQQGNQNFDIAWQQAQLANQAQGAQTASGLVGAGMGALGAGGNIASGMYGTAFQGLGTGANAAEGLASSGANVASLPMQLQNQQIHQAISDYLNYISTSNQGASDQWGAINNSFGQSNNLFGNQIAQQDALNRQQGQALGGIGSLLGAGLKFLPSGY